MRRGGSEGAGGVCNLFRPPCLRIGEEVFRFPYPRPLSSLTSSMAILTLSLVLLAVAGTDLPVRSAIGGSNGAKEIPIEIAPAADTTLNVIELPVRVHLLSSDDPALDSQLDESEVREIFRRVNEVWDAAGIRWVIESIIEEGARAIPSRERERQGPEQVTFVAQAVPRENLTDHMWHVFFVRRMTGAPGIYVGTLPAVIQSEVDPWGAPGLEGVVVRVLAHELGHALNLAHVPCVREGNLMAAGCDSENRIRLTEAQVEVAREQAVSGGPHRGGGDACYGRGVPPPEQGPARAVG